MGRKYKRVSDRGKYGQAALTNALEAIQNGCSLKKAERDFGVPRKTLRRHRDGKVNNPGKSSLGGSMTVLQAKFEGQLVSHIQTMESALFGLTTTDVRKLAYQLAERLGMKHRFNTSDKMAGVDWLRGFLSRNPELSIRSPQATSITRAVGFNRPKVNQFFELFKDLLSKGIFDESKIWNMDETGLSTVQKPCKILATKGKRQVSRMTSAERGQLVTAVCASGASGQYIPPMLIFPRARMSDLLMNGAPVGSIGGCSSSGWTDSELFMTWLQHFVKWTSASETNQHILILDGHHSHKTLDAITYARDHGVHMITLPPHCTHKLQPLDRTFFKSFKANYNRSADSWMTTNPGRRITMYDIAGIFGSAYNITANVERAVKGFKSTGIWPVNELLFSDEDFVAAELTEEPEPEPNASLPEAQPVQSTSVQNDASGNMNSTDEPVMDTSTVTEDASTVSEQHDDPPGGQDVGSFDSSDANKVTSSLPPHPGLVKAMQILAELSPRPKIKTSRVRKRKAESSAVLTSSPYKKQMEEKMKSKTGSKTSLNKKQKKSNKKKSEAKKVNGNKKTSAPGMNGDTTPCIICTKRYNEPPFENWTACMSCHGWYHDSCGPDDVDMCYNCTNI